MMTISAEAGAVADALKVSRLPSRQAGVRGAAAAHPNAGAVDSPWGSPILTVILTAHELRRRWSRFRPAGSGVQAGTCRPRSGRVPAPRSEEHTSELQSRENLVCRLL